MPNTLQGQPVQGVFIAELEKTPWLLCPWVTSSLYQATKLARSVGRLTRSLIVQLRSLPQCMSLQLLLILLDEAPAGETAMLPSFEIYCVTLHFRAKYMHS